MVVSTKHQFQIGIKTITQLPTEQIVQYLYYKLALKSGYLKRTTEKVPNQSPHATPEHLSLIGLPNPEGMISRFGEHYVQELIQQADEIVGGKIRLFGGLPVDLILDPPTPLLHWTDHEKGAGIETLNEIGDIKLVWEPARLGWTCVLARAYYLTGNEHYFESFWSYTKHFLEKNPAYMGWNWTSGQEVAIRLIHLLFAVELFSSANSFSDDMRSTILNAVVEHAARIPPTLAYARAQNNNHLLSEAAALYTAGCCLAGQPAADKWRKLGWHWFHQGIQQQIQPTGAYTQHSTNYHRLMLQLAVWVYQIAKNQHESFPQSSFDKLAAATRWLRQIVDTQTGHVPNLGPNDGAYILPLTVLPYDDFRPVIQAASAVFDESSRQTIGLWDEMSMWLVEQENYHDQKISTVESPIVLRNPKLDTWAYFRVAHFSERPGHADQLHVDLWWQGCNLARDAGTYRYNSVPPWDNALVQTAVHNTISINHQDQMEKAGRFLFLDWAQGQVLKTDYLSGKVSAQHNGYRKFGITHRRIVEMLPQTGWAIIDEIVSTKHKALPPAFIRLHWLLPDWPWQLISESPNIELLLNSPNGPIGISVLAEQDQLDNQKIDTLAPQSAIFRAGECIHGDQTASPVWGWYSPTYNSCLPALSFVTSLTAMPPVRLITRWQLPRISPAEKNQ